MLRKLLKILITLTILSTPLYLVRFEVFSIPTNLLEILIVLTMLGAILTWRTIRQKSTTSNNTKTITLAVIFACVLILFGAILSTWAGGEWRLGLGIIKGWFVLPLIFTTITFFALSHGIISRTKIFRALIVGAALIALVSLLYALFGVFTYDHRLSAFYLSPNHLAMTLAPIVPLTLAGFIIACKHGYSKQTRLFLSLTLPLLFLILFLTRSFGGTISAGIGTLFFLVSYYRSWRVLFIGISTALVGLSIMFLTLWQTPRVQDFFILPEHSSLASRTVVWHVAWDIGTDYVLLGIGPGNFQNMYLAYQKYYPPYPEWAVPQPHNLYLAFWLQTGIVGLAGFLILIYSISKNYWRLFFIKNKNKNVIIALASLASLLTIFLHGLIDTPYWKNDLSLIFWILVLLTYTKLSQKSTH